MAAGVLVRPPPHTHAPRTLISLHHPLPSICRHKVPSRPNLPIYQLQSTRPQAFFHARPNHVPPSKKQKRMKQIIIRFRHGLDGLLDKDEAMSDSWTSAALANGSEEAHAMLDEAARSVVEKNPGLFIFYYFFLIIFLPLPPTSSLLFSVPHPPT